MEDLYKWIGNMDIYLLDQIMKNRFVPGSRILDAGCGKGRNLSYFLRQSFDVYGVDTSIDNIAYVRKWAEPWTEADHFRVEAIEDLSYPKDHFDAIICNAVLHFARNDAHFTEMVHQLWKRLKPGGFWFARLASSIGIEDQVQPLGEGRYQLPDGTERFLVDVDRLQQVTKELGGSFVEPVKTVLVHQQRSMTNWVLRKADGTK
ncbi:bifunctional 2-polyprenyl-6-hydroxyphenol methylase/3-demethylubiquinol 3-O-methyltransferase UbiG [Ammoniphilus sp. YIM 78166]|uniref:class I SAM-dependent methyltransferase n=1 Tax=Ammoniphilus sp. YIM 78166 TaxID=1644106 RepID=UPI00107038DF|nr:class I SAM-dependent methyltransferase [Ammoniphilus sp. YIM 78166]